MTDKYLSSIMDPSQSISLDPSALLTTSTINEMHFPDLTTSGISDTGNTGRPFSLNLDGVGMCESMTESFCSIVGQDETVINNNNNGLHPDTTLTNSMKVIGKKDSLAESMKTQKKRRSRKAQYDASTDGFSLDKIEPVPIQEDQSEPDDAWLFQIPDGQQKNKLPSDNIFSWVHKEFKENDINANKHRLLCKLDDMSHARTIRSISCHSFPANQRSDSVKRSSTEQQVNPESTSHTRLTSPLRSSTPVFNGNGSTRPTSPISSSPLRQTIAVTNHIRSRDVSREREPLDYTDLEVMAKVQLENLRQAERQGPLSKRFGGSSNTLLSADSRDASPVSVFGATRNTSPVSHSGLMTPNRTHSPNPAGAGGNNIPRRKNSFVVTESQYAHVLPSVSPRSSSPAVRSDRPGTKPPVVPRNGTKPNNHRRSNTQTITPSTNNGFDIPDITESKVNVPSTASSRASLGALTNNRTRPPVARTIQTYRGSQTSYLNNQPAVPRTLPKKTSNELGATFTAKQFASSNENGFLNDLSNKPLNNGNRTQMLTQRRTVLPQSSVDPQLTPSASLDMTVNLSSAIPRSSSTLSQGRKSGIPTIGKPSRINPSTMTRPTPTAIPSSQSSDNMMNTRNIRPHTSTIVRPKIPDGTSPTSSWNEGCY